MPFGCHPGATCGGACIAPRLSGKSVGPLRGTHLVRQAQHGGGVSHVGGHRQVATLARHQLQQPPARRVLRRLGARLEGQPALQALRAALRPPVQVVWDVPYAAATLRACALPSSQRRCPALAAGSDVGSLAPRPDNKVSCSCMIMTDAHKCTPRQQSVSECALRVAPGSLPACSVLRRRSAAGGRRSGRRGRLERLVGSQEGLHRLCRRRGHQVLPHLQISNRSVSSRRPERLLGGLHRFRACHPRQATAALAGNASSVFKALTAA